MTAVRWHSRADCGLAAPWGAPAPWAAGQPTAVAVHHTGGPRQRPPTSLAEAMAMWRATQEYHRRSPEGYLDVAYNEAGCGLGGVYHALEGRGTERRPGASGAAANRTHYAIVLLGNHDEFPPAPGLDTGLAHRVRQLSEWYGRPLPVTGHGLLPGQSTACPGRHIRPLLPEVARIAAEPAPQEAPPMAPQIRGSVDRVSNAGPGKLRVQGWAGHDSGAPVVVTIAIAGQGTNRTPTLIRGDVRAAHPGVAQPCGFDATVDAPPGLQRLRVMVSAGSAGATIHDREHDVFAAPPAPPAPPPAPAQPDRVGDLLAEVAARVAELRRIHEAR